MNPERIYKVLLGPHISEKAAISAETLIEHVWHSESDYFSDSVKVHISTLKKKLLSACGNEFIRNIRGAGYLIQEEGH